MRLGSERDRNPLPQKACPKIDMATRIEIEAREKRHGLRAAYEAYKAAHKGKSPVILDDLATLFVQAGCDKKDARLRAGKRP